MSQPVPRTLRVAQSHVRLDDPHLCSDDGSALALQAGLYETLVRRVDAWSFAPSLATRWRVSPDARRWSFTLRQDVLAHDGAALTADDVVASLERLRDPGLGGVLGTEGVYAGHLEGARVSAGVEDGSPTLTMDLARPMADLLDLVADFAIVPRRAHGRHALDPIGSGPYRLLRGDERELALRRWEHHWAGGRSFEQVTFLAEPDPEERVAAVLSGSADVAAQLTPTLADQLDGTPGVRVLQRPSSVCAVCFFGLRDPSSPVTDPRVRRALHHATDVDAIIAQALHGRARRLAGPFTELHLACDPSVSPYTFDPTRARALLAEAGYGDGLELTLDVPTRLPDEAPHVAELLQQLWSEVGVKLHVVRHDDRAAYAQMVRAGAIQDLCCFDSAPLSSYRVLAEKLHSEEHGPWWQGHHDEVLDGLIERAAATPDLSARRELYREAYRRVHDDPPWLYLYSPDALWLVSERVDGWEPTFEGITAP